MRQQKNEIQIPEGINPFVTVQTLIFPEGNYDRFTFDRMAGLLKPEAVEACLTFMALRNQVTVMACLHDLMFQALDDEFFAFREGHREALETVLQFLTDLAKAHE